MAQRFPPAVLFARCNMTSICINIAAQIPSQPMRAIEAA
jgi:hypothetical protein